MKKISRIVMAAAGLAVVMGVAAIAQAQQSPIEQRKALMQSNSAAQRALTPLVRGETPWNKDAALAQVTTINNNAKRIPTLFPAGSEAGSNAQPVVFTNTADFAAKAKGMEDVSARLMQLASAGDEAGFKGAFAQLPPTCAACHQTYRKPQ